MDFVRHTVKKHPYISVFYVWLGVFCMFGWFGTEWVVLWNYLSAVIFPALLIPMYELYLRKKHLAVNKVKKKKFYLALAVAALYLLVTLYLFAVIPKGHRAGTRNPFVLFAAGVLPIAAVCMYFQRKKIWSYRRMFALIVLSGFFLHFYFSVFSEFNYQVDLRFYDADTIGEGHLGYIRYLYYHFLPVQTDPREFWQFYHPPLHHYLQALLLRIQTFFGTDIEIAIYNIKYLPLLYYMFTVITVGKTAKFFHLRKIPLSIVLSVMSFSLGFVFIANYANNDMLSIFLMLHSIYLAMLWYRSRKAVDILKVALCFGLGMFTKLSVWVAAVPIAVIFIAALAEHLKAKEFQKFGRLFGQMWAFLAVAAPLSFYWSIRNYVRFGVPIGYIPVSKDEFQLISQDPVTRIFDFSLFQFNKPYVCTMNNADYCDYNPLIALMKTASSDIYTNGVFDSLNCILLWANILLAAAALISMIYVFVKKNIVSGISKLAIAGFYVVIFASYYIFCIKYPSVCTEDIRYASPLICVGALSLALTVKDQMTQNTARSRMLSKGIVIGTAVFCALSILSVSAYGAWVSLYFNFL